MSLTPPPAGPPSATTAAGLPVIPYRWVVLFSLCAANWAMTLPTLSLGLLLPEIDKTFGINDTQGRLARRLDPHWPHPHDAARGPDDEPLQSPAHDVALPGLRRLLHLPSRPLTVPRCPLHRPRRLWLHPRRPLAGARRLDAALASLVGGAAGHRHDRGAHRHRRVPRPAPHPHPAQRHRGLADGLPSLCVLRRGRVRLLGRVRAEPRPGGSSTPWRRRAGPCSASSSATAPRGSSGSAPSEARSGGPPSARSGQSSCSKTTTFR